MLPAVGMVQGARVAEHVHAQTCPSHSPCLICDGAAPQADVLEGRVGAHGADYGDQACVVGSRSLHAHLQQQGLMPLESAAALWGIAPPDASVHGLHRGSSRSGSQLRLQLATN